MTARRARLSRIRRGVATLAAALFVGSFGAVLAWGRQPARPSPRAATPAAASAPSGADPYTDAYPSDGGAGSYDGSGSAASAPAPMTTRTS